MAGNRSRSKSIINMDALVANVASCNSISSSMEVLVARLDQRGKRRRQQQLDQQRSVPQFAGHHGPREEGWHAIIESSNIATVQTSKGLVDNVYFVPVRAKAVLKIIKKVKPEGILIDSIIDTEDREKSSAKLDEIG
ncbi:hypothetical protein PF008_g10480 [Phytophthora fragariae]|uniref:Carbamoyl phosphate synthase preATP-grasp domain-containing protein n=1 Tax=Phytophthora fragariae TaxID=53985 RepID=A0A6G0RTQ5_9STRA|nr:hypothetical protein PF008_g10480 [Phytophthora fragariae]